MEGDVFSNVIEVIVCFDFCRKKELFTRISNNIFSLKNAKRITFTKMWLEVML